MMNLHKPIILSCILLSASSLTSQYKYKSYCLKSTTTLEALPSSITTKSVITTKIEDLRPNNNEYDRIDTLLLTNEYKNFTKDHAVHDTLRGDGKVEVYEIYKKKDANEIKCIIKFGESLNGHKGIVHGGISSLVIDNTFGWLFMSCNLPSAFTANLNINYKSPVYANTIVVLTANLIKVDGRKLFMEATMEDCEGKQLVNATTLFITMKK
jgi:acyl-coenzyme A thioesterase PaaI-like protein